MPEKSFAKSMVLVHALIALAAWILMYGPQWTEIPPFLHRYGAMGSFVRLVLEACLALCPTIGKAIAMFGSVSAMFAVWVYFERVSKASKAKGAS
ncbi:hypothetical protein ABIC83_002873 [Roseateles asaccharophilus]|uniref:hypothetical protein n=1 Tax=Roseateles asaccharophilus TaxID=582607 RepID=UPI0038377F4F